MSSLPVKRIVSGGQTGVDRGALNAAIALGIDHGGWCPSGRRAEDGTIPGRYDLRETEAAEYHIRTERNVLDSDATLILYRGELTGGTQLTEQIARRHAKPHMSVDLDAGVALGDIAAWLHANKIAVLNVAGPRESSAEGVEAESEQLLMFLFAP